MKTLRLIFTTALASLCLAAASAYGAMTFDYSYTFGTLAGQPPMTVSGQLTANTEISQGVYGDISDVTVLFNGVQAPGTVYVQAPYPGRVDTPVVSYTLKQNNFFFSNDSVKGDYWYFQVYNQPVPPLPTPDSEVNAYYSYQFSYHDDNTWSVVDQWSLVPVPEPTTMIAGALALVLPFGAGALRRLQKNSRQTA